MADGLRLDDLRLRPARSVVAPVRGGREDRDPLSRRIRSEFQEMPGTCLTLAQAIRLFGISPDVGRSILRQLVDEGLLQLTAGERYRLRSSAG